MRLPRFGPLGRRLAAFGVGATGLSLALATSAPADGAAQVAVELRAYVNERCIVADEPFYRPEGADGASARSIALLGLLVGKLAAVFMQQAVGAAAARIGTSGSRRDTRFAVARQTSLYVGELRPAPAVRLNGRFGCLTIVAARFQPDDVDCRARYVPRTVAPDAVALPPELWRTDRTDDSLENPLRRASVCAERAQAVYEARFEFSADGTAYRLRNAGYRVDALLGTSKEGAERSVFYTLDVRGPGRTREPELLSTAWVDLGRVSAGARGAASPAEAEVPWLRVPPLSLEAREYYDSSTRLHQETAGQIDALQRALVRNERVRATLEQRRRAAPAGVGPALRAEIVKIQTESLRLQAELEARRAEYAELPQEPLELMPVSIEIGVTETASERNALRALSKIIEGNRGAIASATLSAASGLVTRRSLESAGAAPPAAPRSELELAREAYYDALVESRLRADGPDATEAAAALEPARMRYELARRAAPPETLPPAVPDATAVPGVQLP